jgi:hypothetical protein
MLPGSGPLGKAKLPLAPPTSRRAADPALPVDRLQRPDLERSRRLLGTVDPQERHHVVDQLEAVWRATIVERAQRAIERGRRLSVAAEPIARAEALLSVVCRDSVVWFEALRDHIAAGGER